MGLLTDSFFITALRSNDTLTQSLPAKDYYNNVAYPDVDMENVELPYIIVNNDGGQNDPESKDDKMEGPVDNVTISIRIVARSRKELADMSLAVRRTIRNYILEAMQRIENDEHQEGDELCPQDYSFQFSDISYDMLKPSHTQMFYYQCESVNETYEQD